MYSVTQRIALLRYENKMPRGGYLSLKDFKITNLYDDKILFEDENLQPGTVGTVVDYLTRFVMGTPKEDAFDISMRGALKTREFIIAEQLLNEINGLDSKSVTAACKLVGFDVCYRAGSELYKPVSDINPNNQTIENIITMVNRSKSFWQKFGPVVKDGICFNGGYSPIVSKGDADFLSKDTIWEFKVIKTPPKPDYRLQLLMYYIMGVVSRQKEFESIEYLGIFNPRLNIVYRCPVKLITRETIEKVCHDVLGYSWTEEEYKDFFRIRSFFRIPAPFSILEKGKEPQWEMVLHQIEKLPKINKEEFFKDEHVPDTTPFLAGDKVVLKDFGRAIIISIHHLDDGREFAVIKNICTDEITCVRTKYLIHI